MRSGAQERWLEAIRPRVPDDHSPGPHLQNLLVARYFAPSFFRIRRSSMKQSPEVVQRTQPIMMITFMSIRAGSLSRLCPANAADSFI